MTKLTNSVPVPPRAVSVEVTEQIETAFVGHAAIVAGRLAVAAAGGRGTLRGTVQSCAERDVVTRIAWAASVVNEVAVSPGCARVIEDRGHSDFP